MQPIFAAAAFLLSFGTFAQTSSKYLEVSINEDVILKVQSLTASLTVESADMQMMALYDSEDYYEDEMYYEEYVDNDWEGMSASERKKYEKLLEKQEKAAEERRIERAEKMAIKAESFKAYTLQDLMKELSANGYAYEIEEHSYSENYEEWMEEMQGLSDYVDTVLNVVLISKEMSAGVKALIKGKPISTTYKDEVYESFDAVMARNATKMAERAKNQANTLATSMDKKAGSIVSISTVYPGFSRSLFDVQSGLRNYRNEFDYPGMNPFDGGKPSYIEIIYRFELKD